MRIAVLMTCYNRVAVTLRCLRGLFSQKLPEACRLDVWLVDDASPDGTGEIVKREFPQVNVVRGTGSLFWCKGMNLAWRSAGDGYDAHLWLNDDVELCDGALEGLLSDADATGWHGAIIGAFRDGDGKITYGVSEKWRFVEPRGRPLLTDGDISGNCVLVPKKVFGKVGIIADCYSHAYGDYDYSARMRKANVPYYLASRFCGRCDDEKHNSLATMSLRCRFMSLFLPGGRNLRDAIIYKYRFYGVFRAIATAVHLPFFVLGGGGRK